MFGRFIIPKASIFYQSNTKVDSTDEKDTSQNNPRVNSMAFVNLRPIVPGHVLVIPQRIVPLMSDLTLEEYVDMWTTVRQVQTLLTIEYPKATAFNVAVQDGKAAGQSVPHVHVHILPRHDKDFERNDDVYTELEEWAPRVTTSDTTTASKRLDVPDDDQRRDRTPQEMADEAERYRTTWAKINQKE